MVDVEGTLPPYPPQNLTPHPPKPETVSPHPTRNGGGGVQPFVGVEVEVHGRKRRGPVVGAHDEIPQLRSQNILRIVRQVIPSEAMLYRTVQWF